MLPIYNKNLQTATPLPTLTLLLGSWWLQNTRTKHINISTYLHKCICIHGKKTLIQIHRNTALLKLMSRFGCLQTFAPEITCRQDRGTSWTTSITHCCIVIRKEQRLGPAFSPRLTTTGHRTWNFFPGNNVMTDIWKKMSLSNPQQAKQFLRRLNIAKMIEHEKNMTKLCIDCMHVIEWYWMSINKYILYIYIPDLEFSVWFHTRRHDAKHFRCYFYFYFNNNRKNYFYYNYCKSTNFSNFSKSTKLLQYTCCAIMLLISL